LLNHSLTDNPDGRITMSNTGYTTTPAGWYPDPAGSPRSRWWDGTQWTETFADAAGAPTGYTTGAAPYTYAQPGVLRAPAGTSPSTIWIWLLALVPFLYSAMVLVMALTGELGAYLPTQTSTELATMSPELSIINFGGAWVIIAANLLFSGLDWHALKSRGIPKPFRWTWAFLYLVSIPVYIIGRTVVVKRRTGSGLAPLFAWIGSLVASFVLSVIIMLVALGPELAKLSQ